MNSHDYVSNNSLCDDDDDEGTHKNTIQVKTEIKKVSYYYEMKVGNIFFTW